MEYTKPEFLDALRSVRWKTVFRTYGNDHSTLVGLLVDWWVTLSPQKNFALESGPGIGGGSKGKGRGNCDAIFGENNCAVGVLEVEGPNEKKLRWCKEKIGRFFGAKEFKSLQFAILLVYSYGPAGRGSKRQVKEIPRGEIISLTQEISEQYSDKGIVVITLDKHYDRKHTGIRAHSDYYKCTPTTIQGVLVAGGKEIAELEIAEPGG